MSVMVTIYDGKGNEVDFPTIKRASQELGVNESILQKRLKDGNWIHRKNGGVPIRIKRA